VYYFAGVLSLLGLVFAGGMVASVTVVTGIRLSPED